MRTILFVLGTRPEAIKLCPLVHCLRAAPKDFRVRVCVTAQHRDMLDQVLTAFSVRADVDLDLMQPGQSLSALHARILTALEPVMQAEKPDVVVVQGDTTTTLAGALTAFYHHVSIAHVEAGLRTGDLRRPFPEEMNRVLISRIAEWHFAPTQGAVSNLLREGVPLAKIHITGNTGIDAVLYVRNALDCRTIRVPPWPWIDPDKHLILVTSHRRENFGPGFDRAMHALAQLAARSDVQLVYPVHRNPRVTGPAHRLLDGLPNVVLLDPLPYVPFVDLMRRSRLIITDSGGIQEEAPSLGKPVLVMREVTERPEAVDAGTVKLVGTDDRRIVDEATRLLEDEAEYTRMTRVHNPYGDGHACERIAAALAEQPVVQREAAESGRDHAGRLSGSKLPSGG